MAIAICMVACAPLQAQSGLLEARVVEGDGQVNMPGSRISRPLVIEVTDETGTRVPDAILSFRLPEDGVTGTFRNGLKTEILRTDSDGRAAMRSLVSGGLAGQFQVRVTAAKGDARAGVISTQFIAPVDHLRYRGRLGILRPNRRVLEIGALVVAVAAAGYVKEVRSSGGASVTSPPVIGSPTITVGKP